MTRPGAFLPAALLAAALAASGRAATGGSFPVTLEASVEPGRVPLNRTARLTVRLTWEGALDSILVGDISDPALSNLEISGAASSNRTEGTASGVRSVKETAFTLKPKSLGMGYVDSVTVGYQDLRSGALHRLKTPRLSLEAVAPLPETSGGPSPLRSLALAAVFAAGAAGGVFLFRRLRRARPAPPAPEPAPPEEAALSALRRTLAAEAANPGEAFAALSRLFRQYLAEAFSVPAREATTAELLASLRQAGAEEGLARKCGEFFEAADVVKFSGRPASPHELSGAAGAMEAVLESRLAETRRRREDRATAEEARRLAEEGRRPLGRIIRMFRRTE
jgi:hypothetical protein